MNSPEITTLLKEAEMIAQSVSAPFQQVAFKCAVELLQGNASRSSLTPAKVGTFASNPKTAKTPAGPRGRIELLIANNFFSQKRGLADVLAGLQEMGYTYLSTDISTTLIRLCRDRKLRRIQENGWKYVNS